MHEVSEPGDWFDWEDVEKSINNLTLQNRHLNLDSWAIKYFGDITPGFKLYWVSNIRVLSGYAGWLEVDLENKTQGRFLCLMQS